MLPTDFRKALLNMVFEIRQFIIYMRFCTSQPHLNTYTKYVKAALSSGGKVNVMQITDKQYERIITFHGKAKQPALKQHPISLIFSEKIHVFSWPQKRLPEDQ